MKWADAQNGYDSYTIVVEAFLNVEENNKRPA